MTLCPGFFDLGFDPAPAQAKSVKSGTAGGCDSCGLYKSCLTPRMPLYGDGRKGILIVGEAPGKTEDERGIPFCGQSGRMLREVLREMSINMKEDCWITNAVICHPAGNKTPTDSQISVCRARLLKIIEEKSPRIILTLGASAVRAVIGHKLTGRLNGVANTAFYGERIPDQEYKAWIIPSYHPAYLLRNEQDIVLFRIWKRHLKSVLELLPKKIPEYDYTSRIQITEDAEQAREWLKEIKKTDKLIAFDYETTGIKPHRAGHKIVCASVASERGAFAFPFFPDPVFLKLWKSIITDSSIGKIAHKLDFENGWTKVFCGYFIAGWAWDTCLATHCLNSQKPVSLKFLVYTNFGIIGYDDPVDKYITGLRAGDDSKSANRFNRIEEAPARDLLFYNAADSLFSFDLYNIQTVKMGDIQRKGFDFFLSGAEALSKVQQEGWCIDSGWLGEQRTRLGKRMDKLESAILKSREAIIWKSSEFKELNFNSNPQLDKLLYKYLGHARPDGPRTDEKAIQKISGEFCTNIVKYRKIKKLRDTYLAQYEREHVNSIIYPFFNLHTVSTFRSSSDSPNFQNVPKRDEMAKTAVRSLIRPRPGNRIIEYDYKSLEVCISACYHRDPNMIKYIQDPSTDMHRDTCFDLFFRGPDDYTKAERHAAKNGFVFPAFYGSTTDNIAPAIWEMISEDMREHLRKNGIKTLNQFSRHVSKIEEKFWGERFRVYSQWKRKVYREYEGQGYIELHTGFRCYGPLKYTEATNYAIQGSAFHCLLQALTWSQDTIKKISGRSAIIGQIHDSIIADVHPEDERAVDQIINENSTRRLRREWPWIIVPLKIEKERSAVDGSWDEMEECAIEE